MFSVILLSHIIGALGIATTIGALLFDVFRRATGRLPRYARLLSVGLFFELTTGSLLAVLAPHASVAAFCQNILTYAGIIFVSLAIIAWRLRSTNMAQQFPRVFVQNSWIGSVMVTIPALVAII